MNCKDKIVLITGASSGIGKACAEQFAAQGAHLILCARREDKLKELANVLSEQFSIKVLPLEIDLLDKAKVIEKIQNLPSFWQNVDILINNAGVALGYDQLSNGRLEDWETVIDVNIKGVLLMIRYLIPQMLKRQTGHIVNIGSISSRYVYAGGSVYCATKYAVRAITETVKMEVHGTPIRVTLINPGMVKTEFFEVRFAGDQEKAEEMFADFTPLNPEDIANTIVFCVNQPAHVDVTELTLVPTSQTPGLGIFRKKD